MKKRASDVSDNSRTNHIVRPKTHTYVDSAGMNRDALIEQSLNITNRHHNNGSTIHVNPRTPRRREYHVLFAECSSQGGRSIPFSLQSTRFRRHTQHFLLSLDKLRELWTMSCGVVLLSP